MLEKEVKENRHKLLLC